MQDDSSRCSKLSIEESKESAMERLGPWMLLEKLGFAAPHGKVIRAYNRDGEIPRLQL